MTTAAHLRGPRRASETDEQFAYRRAASAALRVISLSKNPRTMIGRLSPSAVAWHAAYDAVKAYERTMRTCAALREQELDDRLAAGVRELSSLPQRLRRTPWGQS